MRHHRDERRGDRELDRQPRQFSQPDRPGHPGGRRRRGQAGRVALHADPGGEGGSHARRFALFNNLALAYVALARREREPKEVLRDVPPRLYGLVGGLLLQLEEAREAGEDPARLQEQAQRLIQVAGKLHENLPPQSESAGVVQVIINTGSSIVHNVVQQGRVVVGDVRESTIVASNGNVVRAAPAP